MSFSFSIEAQDGSSRTGVFRTPHGSFQTPAFMPCGTKGAVKTLTPDELTTIGCEIILSNTFHLNIRPGEDVVEKMGGLHRWMNWDKPILTDSGGFQVFSLAKIRTINDDGVEFQSPRDGAKIFMTPESSIRIQEKLGADIIMAFDECPDGKADRQTAQEAAERTHRWAVRCFAAKKRDDQALFPIIQGGIHEDLRIQSAQLLAPMLSPGIAIGGLAVGESRDDRIRVLDAIQPHLPMEKARYLMGIGEPVDLVEAVNRGVDMFDCVIPTRLGRHGSFWDAEGRRNIHRAEYRTDPQPLMQDCRCLACQKFSRSYLHHLIMEGEILGHRLLTIHNLTFLIDLMRKIRQSIEQRTFQDFRRQFLQLRKND